MPESSDTAVENQALLDEIADDMGHDLMDFLHDCRVAVGPYERKIGDVGDASAAIAGKSDGNRAATLRGFEREHHVAASCRSSSSQ